MGTIEHRDSVGANLHESKQAPNLAANGAFQDFTLGPTSQPDGFTDVGTPDIAQVTGERDNWFDSPQAVRYTATGAANEGGSITLSALKPSTTYTITVRVKATAGGDTARIFTTGAGTEMDEESFLTDWNTLSGTFITDATPTDVVISLVAKTDTDIVFFGQLMVREGNGFSTFSPKFTDSAGSSINLWKTFAGDSGSTTADDPNDTITIAGGTNIGTSISGDTVTINLNTNIVMANGAWIGQTSGGVKLTFDDTNNKATFDGGDTRINTGASGLLGYTFNDGTFTRAGMLWDATNATIVMGRAFSGVNGVSKLDFKGLILGDTGGLFSRTNRAMLEFAGSAGAQWTTSNFNASIQIPTSNVIRWPKNTTHGWGMLQESNVFKIGNSTADDNSAAFNEVLSLSNDIINMSQRLDIISPSVNGLSVQNSNNGPSNQVAIFKSGDRAVPADNDEGYFSLHNDDSTGTQVEFSRITWIATDVTNTAKAAGYQIELMQNNTLRDYMHFSAAAAANTGAIVFNEDGQDIDFRVEGSGSANAFFVQGSNGNVGIGTNSPAQILHIENAGGPTLRLKRTGFHSFDFASDATAGFISTAGAAVPIIFRINNVEKMRLGSGGEVFMPAVYSDAISSNVLDLQIQDDGQLGIVVSSKKYKKNIRRGVEANIDTSWIYDIEIVKWDSKDEKLINQIGPIAEEVVDINSEVVGFKRVKGAVQIDGKDVYYSTDEPETVVKSRFTYPMLREMQKLRKDLDTLL